MNITQPYAVQRRSLIGHSCVQLDATGNKHFMQKYSDRKNALRIWSVSRLLAIRKGPSNLCFARNAN